MKDEITTEQRQVWLVRQFTIIAKNIRSNLVGYIATALGTVAVNAFLFIWATGGAILQLPNTVEALQTQADEFTQLVEEQANINRDQQELNHTQQVINESLQSTLQDIKEDLREINNYLRAK